MLEVKKSNQKKEHPNAVLGGLRLRDRERGRAFRQGSCPDEKGPTSLSIPLRALSSPLTHRIRGPWRALHALLKKVKTKSVQVAAFVD
jgi:hypothetical protein